MVVVTVTITVAITIEVTIEVTVAVAVTIEVACRCSYTFLPPQFKRLLRGLVSIKNVRFSVLNFQSIGQVVCGTI